MAHSNEVKAYALALLMLGNRVNHVARVTNLPRQTVSRWRLEADQIIVECFRDYGDYPTLPELGRHWN